MGLSSFILQAGVLASAALGVSAAAAATSPYLYTQDHRYAGATFFDQFNFVTAEDPTHGFVSFKSMADAKTLGLAKTMGTGAAYLGVDTTKQYLGTSGRPSTRLESKRIYNGGLFVADIAHMPTGAGTWPALWTVGLNNWPADGEIDILEGINEQTVNLATLHTSDDCLIDASSQGGTLKTSHCSNSYTDYSTQWQNQGCSLLMTEANTYGTGFNNAGGAVYVVDWQPDSDYIKIWMLARTSAAGINALSANPDPSTWSKPAFTTENGSCNIAKQFKDHSLVLDTTFCGDYAGQDIQWQQTSVYKSNPTKYATCQAYVGANPSAFTEAYWLINSINVYNRGANPAYVTPAIVSPDGSCGSKYTCAGYANTLGYSCCNKSGRCGSTAADCVDGCKTGYSTAGKCIPTAAVPLAISPDGTCGSKYTCAGYANTLGYSCCNKNGRCGSTAADCADNCKTGYSTADKCIPTAAAPLAISPDGTCGSKYTCAGYANTLGYSCCNKSGRCGSTAADCADNCKTGYSTSGKCIPTAAAPTTLVTSPDGSCGNKYTCANYSNALGYSCCNKSGRCGSTNADCGVDSGCKVAYSTAGKCGVASPVTAAAAKANLVKSPNGTCGNLYTCTGYADTLGYSCCSAGGNCASTAAACGTGCKIGYGACFA